VVQPERNGTAKSEARGRVNGASKEDKDIFTNLARCFLDYRQFLAAYDGC
jgi:hypothetical protein